MGEFVFTGIVYFVVLLLSLYIMFVEATFAHELGHLHTARKYQYTKARMWLKRAHMLYPLKDCELVRGKIEGHNGNGRTDLENNYQVYTDEQIRDIAKAGVRYAIIFCGIVGAIFELLMLVLYLISPNPIYLMGVIYQFLIPVLAIVFHVGNYHLSARDSKRGDEKKKWCDKNISNAPAEYRKYMKELSEEAKA